MRFPETAHHWAGVEKADWEFRGDEVLVETMVETIVEAGA
jgi:hypothetical protein